MTRHKLKEQDAKKGFNKIMKRSNCKRTTSNFFNKKVTKTFK